MESARHQSRSVDGTGEGVGSIAKFLGAAMFPISWRTCMASNLVILVLGYRHRVPSAPRVRGLRDSIVDLREHALAGSARAMAAFRPPWSAASAMANLTLKTRGPEPPHD